MHFWIKYYDKTFQCYKNNKYFIAYNYFFEIIYFDFEIKVFMVTCPET